MFTTEIPFILLTVAIILAIKYRSKLQDILFTIFFFPKNKSEQHTSQKNIAYEPLPETFPIDIRQFIKTDSPAIYDIPFSLRYLAYDSLDTINVILSQTSNLVASFPETVLLPEDVNFRQSIPEDRDHTFLSYHPYTKTGKIAKYPYSVCFHSYEDIHSGTCLFGNVYHLVDGHIGKIDIVRWHEQVLYKINAGIIKGSLQVIKLEKSELNEMKTLYNYNAR